MMFTGFESFSFCKRGDHNFLDTASASTQGFRLSTVRSSGHRIDLRETATCSVLVPLRGSIKVVSDDCTVVAVPGDGIIALSGKRTTQLSSDYLGIVSVTNMTPETATGTLLRPSAQLRSFISYLVDCFECSDYLASNPGAHQAMASMICELVQQSLAHQTEADSLREHDSTRLRHVAAAEEWMDEHAGELYSVSDLANAVGLTTRSLQLAFQRHRNCTPRQAIERKRLYQVRKELLCGALGRTVTSVALECGVLHLGRFAASYRRLFGENPSDTLARAQKLQ